MKRFGTYMLDSRGGLYLVLPVCMPGQAKRVAISMVRIIVAFLISVVSTFLLASFFHTQNILQRLSGLGIDFTIQDRLNATLRDIHGLSSLYLPIIAITLLLGFLVAFILKKKLTALAPIAYPLAGLSAMGAMLVIMEMSFDIVPIASARGMLGVSLHMLAGGLGGGLFSILAKTN